MSVYLVYGVLLTLGYPACNRVMQRRIMRHWARGFFRILCIRLIVQGDIPATQQGRLFVANHVSWMDPAILDAVMPAYFVAKAEVAGWPVLGWVCRRLDTLFIRRNVRRDAMGINGRIAELLRQGECVAAFPEGTTTTGGPPGHFHSSLLQGAMDANAQIQPVAIRYHDADGHYNPDAAYVGEMTFMESLVNVIRSPSLRITVTYLPPLPEGENRRAQAARAHEAISAALPPWDV